MIAIQIIALLFVVWMTYFSFLHFRRREFTLTEYAFWQIIWLGLAIIVIFQATTRIITRTLGFYRAFDFLTVGGIIILFGVTFRNYVLLRRNDRRLEELTRKLALK